MKIKFLAFYNLIKTNLLQNRTTKQTIFKNTFWLFFGEGLSKVILFFNTVLITRYLGVTNYGEYSFAFAFATLFGIIVDFGFNALVAREIAENKKAARKYIDNILPIKFILSFITYGLIFVLIQFFGKTEDIKSLVYLASISVIIQSFITFFEFIFQGYEKMQYIFISSVAFASILIVSVLIIIINKQNAPAITAGYIFASFSTLFILLIITHKFLNNFLIEFDLKFWKKIILEAWPFFAGWICIMIYVNSDSILLGIFRSYREVGLYQAAYKIFFAFQTINLVHQVIYPKLSFFFSRKEFIKYKKLLRTFFVYSIYLLIPLGLIVSLFSEQILYILYGKAYINAAFALSVLIWTGVLIYFSIIWSNSLLITKKQKKWFYSTLMGATVNLGLNLILIPRFGLNAAALTTLFSEIIVFIFIYTQSDKKTRNFFIN